MNTDSDFRSKKRRISKNKVINHSSFNSQHCTDSNLSKTEPTKDFKTISQTKNTYVEQLEHKIQQQAKRLGELAAYKALCEKRIKQLNPSEVFPLTQDSIKTKETESISKVSEDNYVTESITDSLSRNKKNTDVLNEKYKKLLKDFHDIIQLNNSSSFNENESAPVNQERYNKLKAKYNRMKEENEKIINLLREETLAAEEQKNIIALLQQTINNDLKKNKEINKCVTPENLVDFTEIKNEAEQYRKELVLSQALINSLKSDNEQLIKEKDEMLGEKKKMEDEIRKKLDDIKKRENKISSAEILQDKINSQEKIISNLMDENSGMKTFVEDNKRKLKNIYKENSDSKLREEQLNIEISKQNKELHQYEEKLIYFNDYISMSKAMFMSFQEILKKYILIYNKVANEDLQSLLSNNFSTQILNLNSKLNRLRNIEKFNLETDIENSLYQIILELLKTVNDEFIIIYEKVFQTNSYYKEANEKIDQLQQLIDSKNNETQEEKFKTNNLLAQIISQKQCFDDLQKEKDNVDMKMKVLRSEKDNLFVKNTNLNKEKDEIIDFCKIANKLLARNNFDAFKMAKEGLSILEGRGRLYMERDLVYEQYNKQLIKDSGKSKEIIIMLEQEKTTLEQLIKEFDSKIKEKNIRLEAIKNELRDMFNKQGNNLLNIN